MATVLTLLFVLLAVLHLSTASVLNVAEGKPASMSSSWTGHNASTAVDGNTDAGGYGPDQIILTKFNQSFARLKLDLNGEVQDATVKIYFLTVYKKRRNGVKLYTSTNPFPISNPTRKGQLCHTVTGDQSGSDIPDVYNVTCPGRWRYLLLYTDTDVTGRGPVLDFGEVEVLVCQVGKYGKGCEASCNEGCDINKCGNCKGHCKEGWTGNNCVDQCPPGLYGQNCRYRCSRGCEGSVCNRFTGTCQICEVGFRHADDYLRCDLECESGTFGDGCEEMCSPNCKNTSCHHVYGVCLFGCLHGWTGNSCQQATDEEVTNYLIVSSITAVALIMSVCLAVAVFIIRRLRKRQQAARTQTYERSHRVDSAEEEHQYVDIAELNLNSEQGGIPDSDGNGTKIAKDNVYE